MIPSFFLQDSDSSKINELKIYRDIRNSSQIAQRITTLYNDSFHGLWIGTTEALHCLILTDGSLSQFLTDETVVLNEPVENIRSDDIHNFWMIHSGNKISKFNIHKRTLETLPNLLLNTNPDAEILDLETDNLNGIWMIYDGLGIHRYNLESTGYSEHLFDRLDKIENLFENDVTRLFQDRSGCIWACTRGGLAQISINKPSFHVLSHYKKRIKTEMTDDISTISIDSNNYYWINHWMDGPYRFQMKENQFEEATPELLQQNLYASALTQITGILMPSGNRIWFCTLNGHGIQEYHYSDNVDRFIKEYSIRDGLPSDSINFAYYDNNKNIWVGTTKGIAKYNHRNRTFFSRINNSASIFEFSNNITSIEQTRDDIWFGTRDGLLIRRKNSPDNSDDNSLGYHLPGDWIMSIKQGGDSVLWLGTWSGLYKFHIISETLEKINESIVPSSPVVEIQIGKDGNLWLGTLTGLIRVDPGNNGSQHFNAANGLLINHINWRASAQDNSGNMYFGTKAGLIYFDPENVVKYMYIPEVVISRFLVDNQPWPIEKYSSQGSGGDYNIILPYNNNNLSFEFSGLSYVEQDRNQYMYRFSGLNEQWNSVDYKGRFTSYSNLSPGDYTFEVKASNFEGIWNPTPLRVNIHIRQIFWKSTFAIFLYLVIIMSIFLLIYFETRTRKILKEKLLHEKLERRKTEELNELKLRFYTNITHEFRSPLTMIINPVNKLMNHEFRPAMKKELDRIRENTMRMMVLINQLLDFRKVSSQGITPYFRKDDIEAFFLKQIELQKILVDQKKQHISFVSELADKNFVFDSFILEKIISNLISNASKFSPPFSEIHVHLKNASQEVNQVLQEGIILSVADKGKGISEEHLDQIFNRFYQVDPDGTGTGIGLSLVNELVAIHKGTIKVISEVNKGSNFIIFIPEIKANIQPDNYIPRFIKPKENSKPSNSSLSENENPFRSTGKVKILFVDDDEEFLAYMAEEFSSLYEVQTARNGQKAWESIQNEPPDIVISDINMPEFTGFELCQAIKSDFHYSHIPVILLTVENSDVSREHGYDFGADSYLEKPINLHLLNTRIQNILKTLENTRIKYQKSLTVEPSEITTSSMDEKFLQKALEIIEKNIDNPEFNNDSFCLEMGVSNTQLYKKLKSLLGLSASEFIKDIRLKRAAQLLKSNSYNISEVAYYVDLSTPNTSANVLKINLT